MIQRPSVWLALGALLSLVCTSGNAFAADVRTVLSMGYDSNPFEEAIAARGGWVSRFFVSSTGYPFAGKRSRVQVQHQAGVKRVWESATDGGEMGDVVVNHITVQTQTRVWPRVGVAGNATLKVKQATHVPGEESYLRGALGARVTGQAGAAYRGTLFGRWGGDDSRDASLPEVSLRELGLSAEYGKTRRLTGRLTGTWRWMDYDRPALTEDPNRGVVPAKGRQSDLLRVLSADVQVYRGMLVHVTYAYLSNHSNSFGYGFHAHRFQGILVRPVGLGIDAQVFFTFQFRHYDDPLDPVPGQISEADEYEQTMGVLKLSRQLAPRWSISLQYGFHRNGARRSGAFYRKHVYTCSVEAAL